MGADTSITGLDHLHSISFKRDNLKPLTKEQTYAADSVRMQLAISFVRGRLHFYPRRYAINSQ